ncbi:PEP-CTERM sorting domain-containing protein [Planctomycetota bacterium]
MVMRKIILFTLIVYGMVFIQSAQAALLDPPDLPDGSIYSGESYRQIETNGGYLAVRVDFAVYDTEANPDAWGGENGFDNPGGGQYIYAYRIVNYEDYSTEALGSFGLLNENGQDVNEADAAIMGTGWENDMTEEDISPESTPTASSWSFNGFFFPNERSSLLVISSNHSWTKGDYSLGAYQDPDFPVAEEIAGGGDVLLNPEPATIMLLGVGGVTIIAKFRRKKSPC